MKVSLTIGANKFEVEGDTLTFDDGFMTTLRSWIHAVSAPAPNPDDIAAQLEQQTDALATAVQVHSNPVGDT